MSTKERMTGNWNQLKGKVKQRWGQLTDDELSEVEGNVDQLVGLIQQKTGDARETIQQVVDELSESAGGAVAQATETAPNMLGKRAMRFARRPIKCANARLRPMKRPKTCSAVVPSSRLQQRLGRGY